MPMVLRSKFGRAVLDISGLCRWLAPSAARRAQTGGHALRGGRTEHLLVRRYVVERLSSSHALSVPLFY